jgi:hypothetical protein
MTLPITKGRHKILKDHSHDEQGKGLKYYSIVFWFFIIILLQEKKTFLIQRRI